MKKNSLKLLKTRSISISKKQPNKILGGHTDIGTKQKCPS